MMRALPTFFLFLFFPVFLFAQSPKREFRAAWIATVANIDWPSKPGLPSINQQQQFTALLDKLKGIGCNAVIVQVRPACDAFYPSDIEPWSHYLTGKQGVAPFPFYDPLKFMIDETHKRNMEFHAWFNPFRALMDSRKNPNPPSHVTHRHPDWVINYGGKSYLDPGNPAVREYVIKVITDVVKRYDIDGVHLDDYFYPYRVAGEEFGDYRSYKQYGENMQKDDWRRNNVSLFMSLLYTNIKHIKSYVKVGVSPFGVWRNVSKDPEGSATRAGQTDYDDLYADVVLWCKRGWVDYL
ncbi:MAG TPA: family 10 glycosylhydrolase, partial [Flavipsychrobacter sp.]|nr:family 10 glycosylhydrolase [Flavipsychrobacter sp.]